MPHTSDPDAQQKIAQAAASRYSDIIAEPIIAATGSPHYYPFRPDGYLLFNRPIIILGPDVTMRNKGQYSGNRAPIFVLYNGVDHCDAMLLASGYEGWGQDILADSARSAERFPQEDVAHAPSLAR